MITIVTGMPRAGTTLMMHMLSKAGMEVYADHPLSLETKNALELPIHSAWLDEAEGCAVKILNIGKHYPPPGDYKFIWMKRNITQQAKSQRKYRRKLLNQRVRKGEEKLIRRWITEQTRKGLELCRELGETHIITFEDALVGNVDRLANAIDLDADKMREAIFQRDAKNYHGFMENKYIDNAK